MTNKYLNYVGDIITDVDYQALGAPEDYLEIRTECELPFRLYCHTRNEDWEEVTETERLQLIKKLKDDKSKFSKSDSRYYKLDFHLASLGER